MERITQFGGWLKERRQSLDMTQENLADRVGCALSTIEKIERGLRRPSHQIAGRLAEELHIPDGEREAFIAWARTPPAGDGVAEEDGVKGGKSATQTTATATMRPPATNLPAQATSLIGRERELAEVGSLLRQEDVRLLTLLGPPGIGKTRLSLALAASMDGEFRDGVWFVPLAPISDPSLVASSIAVALGVKGGPGQTLEEALQSALRDREMLLVLDNFEQVLAAAPLISGIMSVSPGLKVVVTSRAALQIYGERHFDVPPLPAPDPKNLPVGEALQAYPAVDLFVQRAQAVAPRFAINEANAGAVAEICARLDGLPLAIELAAARSKLFDPLSLLRRLDRRLPMLSGGPHDHTPRQQSLRGAITWSYDLLSDTEKALFRAMSVFAGGCTLDALEVVAGAAEPDGVSTCADELESLVKKSLAYRQDVAGDPRFAMLETLREYAGERLRERGEADATRRRHAEFVLALTEEAEPHLRGAEQQRWLERLDKEQDNLRAALVWALENGQAEVGQRIAGSVWRYWSMRCYFIEGRSWLERVLETWPQNTSWRVKVGLGAGGLAQSQSDYARARRYLEESLEGARQLGDKLRTAQALNNLGIIDRQQGNSAAARAALMEAVEIQREIGDRWSMAGAYTNLGLVAADMGDYEGSRRFQEQSLALFKELGDKRSTAIALINLGDTLHLQGDNERSRLLWEECVETFREIGDKRALAQGLMNLAFVARDTGDLAKGYTLIAEVLDLYDEIGRRKLLAEALEYVGTLAALDGQPERAARLFGAADANFRELEVVQPPDMQQSRSKYETLARKSLGDEQRFDALWREGGKMTMEEGVSYALEEPGVGVGR